MTTKVFPSGFIRSIPILLFMCSSAWAGTLSRSLIYRFVGPPDGSFPSANVISDPQGNLYGTTLYGGTGSCSTVWPGCGTVFELSPVSGGGWSETVLYSFTGSDGAHPTGGLIRDARGNLYGTTQVGGTGSCVTTEFGAAGCGTVFALTPPSQSGDPWSETVLYSFQSGTDGLQPYAGLVFDAIGNLYGTTIYGGVAFCGCGTIFKLSRPAISGGQWTEELLYSFNDGFPSNDGEWPFAPLIFDAAGNLYGTTASGGTSQVCGDQYYYECGTVFELSPPSVQGDSWTESILYTFDTFGNGPMGGVIFDPQGNLYGTTFEGPGVSGDFLGGIVFELSPPTQTGGAWTETTLYTMNDYADSPGSTAGLTFDRDGNLFGTSTAWPGGQGTVFKLVRTTANGGSWIASSVGRGGHPDTALTWGYGSALYGTTFAGGSELNCGIPGFKGGCGTVFKVVP